MALIICIASGDRFFNVAAKFFASSAMLTAADAGAGASLFSKLSRIIVATFFCLRLVNHKIKLASPYEC